MQLLSGQNWSKLFKKWSNLMRSRVPFYHFSSGSSCEKKLSIVSTTNYCSNHSYGNVSWSPCCLIEQLTGPCNDNSHLEFEQTAWDRCKTLLPAHLLKKQEGLLDEISSMGILYEVMLTLHSLDLLYWNSRLKVFGRITRLNFSHQPLEKFHCNYNQIHIPFIGRVDWKLLAGFPD